MARLICRLLDQSLYLLNVKFTSEMPHLNNVRGLLCLYWDSEQYPYITTVSQCYFFAVAVNKTPIAPFVSQDDYDNMGT